MRIERLGFVFRVKLDRDKVRMCLTRQFDHLDELAVGRDSAEYQAFSLKHFAKLGIEFVPVTVPLSDLRCSMIDLACE